MSCSKHSGGLENGDCSSCKKVRASSSLVGKSDDAGTAQHQQRKLSHSAHAQPRKPSVIVSSRPSNDYDLISTVPDLSFCSIFDCWLPNTIPVTNLVMAVTLVFLEPRDRHALCSAEVRSLPMLPRR